MELNSQGLYQSLGKEKKEKVVVLFYRPRQKVKLGTFTLSSRSDGKKCTKKRDARTMLLFCQFKPIAFFAVLVAVAVVVAYAP